MRVSIPGVESPPDKIHFSFEGKDVEARRGDTVAASLLNGGLLACREVGDGSYRGIFCGMGACNECAVVVNGEPGHLACMIQSEEGMVIEGQPSNPPHPDLQPAQLSHVELSPAVLVVGGGPAGLSAAATIAEAGTQVLLVDERPKLGGQFYKQPGPDRQIDESALDKQYRSGRKLVERALAAGVEMMSDVSIWGAFGRDLLMAYGAGKSWTLRPRRLVLATGAQERPVPIPGWTLPGVMTTGAAQTLLRSSQISPGQRVLLSGNGPLNMQVAAELVRAGVDVVALVEQADLRWWANLGAGVLMAIAAAELVKQGMEYRWTLIKAGVPVLDRCSVVAMTGEDQVENAVVASVGPSGRQIVGTEREFEVDAVCLGYGFIPSNEIARALGCDHHVDTENGALVTTRSNTGRTSVESVWVIGDAGDVFGAYAAEAQGAIAGSEVASELGLPAKASKLVAMARVNRSLRRHRGFQRGLHRLYKSAVLTKQLADDETIVCRCESVTLESITRSFSEGVTSAGASKRVTRAGMGKCQGRYCSPTILALAHTNGSAPDQYSGFAPQAPVRPIEITRVAGSISPKNSKRPT